MTWAGILIPLASGVAGWFLRHWGFGVASPPAPQSPPASGGVVPPPPASTDWRTELRAILRAELDTLVGQLSPPPATLPLKSKA